MDPSSPLLVNESALLRGVRVHDHARAGVTNIIACIMWQALAPHHLCVLPIKWDKEKGSDHKGMHIYQKYFEKKVANTNIVKVQLR